MVIQNQDLDDLIKRFRDEKEISNDKYFTEILNYFKWITTFDFTLIVWIGSNIHNKVYCPNLWVFLSIIFILISIIIAIITSYFILEVWNNERELKYNFFQLTVAYHVNENLHNDISKKDLEDKRKLAIKSSEVLFKLPNYNKYLILHIATLFIGIVFYLFAIYFFI